MGDLPDHDFPSSESVVDCAGGLRHFESRSSEPAKPPSATAT